MTDWDRHFVGSAKPQKTPEPLTDWGSYLVGALIGLVAVVYFGIYLIEGLM